MRQLKIFEEEGLKYSTESDSTAGSIQECINYWIKQNPGFTVLGITASEYMNQSTRNNYKTCYVLYEDNTNNVML